jgi:hypothetical protein
LLLLLLLRDVSATSPSQSGSKPLNYKSTCWMPAANFAGNARTKAIKRSKQSCDRWLQAATLASCPVASRSGLQPRRRLCARPPAICL